MKGGSGRISDAVKRRRGTFQPSRAAGDTVSFAPVKAAPRPPGWLNRDGRAEWRRLVALLMADNVLTDADLGPLAHLCALHGLIVAGYRDGAPPKAAALTQLRLYSAEFGLTPSSRARVPAAPSPAGASPADEAWGRLTRMMEDDAT